MSLYDVLMDLFLVDRQVRGLESRLVGADQHSNAQNTKLEALRNELAESQRQLRQTQATEANLENDVNATEGQIAKLRMQMSSVKTNKEYSAILVEVNTRKVDKAKIEERALALMAEIELLQKSIEAMRAKVSDQEKIHQMAVEEVAKRRGEVGQRLDELRGQRAIAAQRVPQDALTVFNRLAITIDGDPMSPVIIEDPRDHDYTCGGCYMQIPAEQVNQLASREKLVRCTSCTRILYMETKAEAAVERS